jgi:hypothetical protein
MRIVVSIVVGLAAGYVLHSKKDQSLDSIANGVVNSIRKNHKTVADRFAR